MANSEFAITINVGALNNAKRPGPRIGSAHGGITVKSAEIVMSAAGTAAFNLVDLGTAGTAVAGTIATLGSNVFVANVPVALTVTVPYVAEGHYLGVEETNVGPGATVTVCYVKAIVGK